MITSLLYLLPAILGLSVLIFFHELGHYYMARLVGMRVEVFAIGFGRPIYSWERKGVKWQIGWLPFGGYVRIVGQDLDGKRDPYDISDGFFGKRPIDRIKVALAGPVVNIILALIIFTAIWALGGREKNFSEFTHKIGWIDPNSELYADGIRPGDEITAYNHTAYQGARDHLFAPMISSEALHVEGIKIDYLNGKRNAFDYTIKPYTHPQATDKGRLTAGITGAANYMIYDRQANTQDNPLPEGSPMQNSGILYGDRIVWVDDHLIFGAQQMSYLLNDQRVLLTIERDGKTLLVRVPRIMVHDLKLEGNLKDELADWQYEAGLSAIKWQNLYTLPYNLTSHGVVENELKFIDKEKDLETFPKNIYGTNEKPLLAGDKIIAISGAPITSSYELLAALQVPAVNIIVERSPKKTKEISWKDEDADFDRELNIKDIQKIAESIGTAHPIKTAGNYVLLNPVIPKPRLNFDLAPEKRAALLAEQLEQKKEIENIEDADKRAYLLNLIKNQESQLVLGVPVQDRKVHYNPGPISQFDNVFSEIWTTLGALVSGDLSPKWMSGPIGIVQVVRDSWMLGIKDALFWLGAISLNLGILNLMPIPVLDGGTIMLSLFELVTGKRIKPKTLEKVVMPFAFLLIAFFIFITYQDLSRIFTFLHW